MRILRIILGIALLNSICYTAVAQNLTKESNKILGVNDKINFFGGERTTPVNEAASDIAQDVVYDYSQLYEEKESNRFYVSATINYRINKKRHSSIWSLQFVNLFLIEENYGTYYNYNTQQVEL